MDKQIIIDGVDVSGCEHINTCDNKIKCVILQDDVCETNPYCEDYNCYFKQLKRKEQELQAQINYTEQEQRKIYCAAYDKTCETGNECKQKGCVFKDRLKYKQALDIIEEYCMQCNLRWDFTAQIVLNTINKLKEN